MQTNTNPGKTEKEYRKQKELIIKHVCYAVVSSIRKASNELTKTILDQLNC